MNRVRGLLITIVVAFAVFCVVQDLVTAAGARRYVELQQRSLAGRAPAVTVDEVMRPAIANSVRDGLLSAGAVMLIGLALVRRSNTELRIEREHEPGNREP